MKQLKSVSSKPLMVTKIVPNTRFGFYKRMLVRFACGSLVDVIVDTRTGEIVDRDVLKQMS